MTRTTGHDPATAERTADPERDSRLSPEELRNQLFSRIVESSPHGVVMIDRAAQVVLVNREASRMFGYKQNELVGAPLETLVPARFRRSHPDFREDFFANPHTRAMGEGRDLYGLRKDSTEIPIEIGLNPIRIGGGLYVLASVVDITERKSAEARFRVAVEASPHGMLMADPSGRIVLVNRELEAIFAYSRDELLGQSVDLLVPMEVQNHHPALRQQFHDSPQSRPMGAGRDLFGRRRDGVQIPVEIALNPIETDEGIFVLASVVDISPRKQAEEELRRSNEELEQFAYVASHDLQEPLRTVSSYVQLLARRYSDKLDTDAREFIDFAVSGAARMQRLIEDLLAFSRVGTSPHALVAQDTNKVFQAAIDDLRASIVSSSAEVTHDPLPEVLADAGQLEQLFANLIGNALKFQAEDAPQIHVSAEVKGRFCEFSVSDNGVGLKPEHFDRVFVIFQRLHERDMYEGTGVGLAICKKIVERHGGRIWVTSTAGSGATFHFTLPAVPL